MNAVPSAAARGRLMGRGCKAPRSNQDSNEGGKSPPDLQRNHTQTKLSLICWTSLHLSFQAVFAVNRSPPSSHSKAGQRRCLWGPAYVELVICIIAPPPPNSSIDRTPITSYFDYVI